MWMTFSKTRCQRSNIVSQFGQQFMLNYIPTLHDQFMSFSIHFTGVRCFFKNFIMLEMARPRLQIRTSKRIIQLEMMVLQEAHLAGTFEENDFI